MIVRDPAESSVVELQECGRSDGRGGQSPVGWVAARSSVGDAVVANPGLQLQRSSGNASTAPLLRCIGTAVMGPPATGSRSLVPTLVWHSSRTVQFAKLSLFTIYYFDDSSATYNFSISYFIISSYSYFIILLLSPYFIFRIIPDENEHHVSMHISLQFQSLRSG